MRLGLIAKKIGMSRFYDSVGVNHPVTIVKVDNCKVIDFKTPEKNGYSAIRISYGTTKKKSIKPEVGFLKKINIPAFEKSREFRVENSSSFKLGDNIGVDNFIEGQFVDVSSNSIGKGFAGGMKRHNFAGNRATHGVSISHRSHGSTGQCQDPGKVFKGKKMAGRLGNVKVTIQNLKILKIDVDNNLILIKGAIPGHKGSIVKIVDSKKKIQNINIVPKNSINNEENEADNKVKNESDSNNEEKIVQKNDSGNESFQNNQNEESQNVTENKNDNKS